MEPLAGNTRYQKVGLGAEPPTCSRLLGLLPHPSHATMQLRDLNKGTFGFVQLALDTESNTQVAIKFIERGDKVGCNALQSALKYSRMCCCLAGCLTAICCAADFQVCGTGNTESQASESPSHCGAQGGQHCC